VPERGATSEGQGGRKVVLFAGAGAVERSWEPVRRALRKTFPALLTADNAAFAVAHLVYQLRLACSRPAAEDPAHALGEQLRGRLERVRREIAGELRRAQDAGELRTHVSFDRVVERLALAEDAAFTLITTNWDEVVDRRVRELCGPIRAKQLSIHHLHGRLSEPDSLYLPSEMRCEPYRDQAEARALDALHTAAMRDLERADRMIVYGVSLSPLDVELAFAIGEVCRRGTLADIHVIDRDACAVAERLSITLGRSDLPPIHCSCPDELERSWLFPDGCVEDTEAHRPRLPGLAPSVPGDRSNANPRDGGSMQIPVREAKNVDLNAASEEEQAEDVGLGAGRARRIVESRPFADWDDLSRVEGVTASVVEELKSKGAIIGPPAGPPRGFASDGREHDQLDKSIRADTYKGGPGERSATRPKN
jgi:hypothetical protein